MNYHAIRYQDTLNGPGYRTVLFVAGCEHHCKGCHNPETWDPDSGKPFTDKEMNEIIESLKNPDIDGITFSGGDPLYVFNLYTILDICRTIRRTPETSNKSIWVYTGYVFEERIKSYCNRVNKQGFDTYSDISNKTWCTFNEILKLIDVLVDGPFIESLKDSNYIFAGSTNQRLIDMKATLTDVKRDELGNIINTGAMKLWHSKF
jgi:anaerobic ribonucleoside-triphosphate reductase activating protein